MPDRAAEIADFLRAAGVGAWTRAPLAGDASRRRYERLSRGGETRILMDAPPGTAEEIARFRRIAGHLRGLGLAAPRIHAADPARGLMLLDDLGPDHVAAHLARHPAAEREVYLAATDILARLQAAPPPPGLAHLDPETGAAMIAPALAAAAAPPALAQDLRAELAAALAAHAGGSPVLALRDYHAENLVWRGHLCGPARIGLLDFQDALGAHPAYDLASLLRDVRRDVHPDTDAACRAAFAAAAGIRPEALGAALATLSVQRNLRILGIFARLIRDEGKPRYAAFLPRLRAHLAQDLGHPALARLRPLALRLTQAAPA